MSKIALKLVEEMHLSWDYGQVFHTDSIYYSSTIIEAILLIYQIGTVQSLNCTFLKSEQKIIKKQMTSSKHTKFAQFWVVSVRKCMVKKFLISYYFVFFSFSTSRFFDNSVRAFFILFGQEVLYNFKIAYLFQSLFSIIKV